MSAPSNRPVDPRVHAVRTLAQLLVRHGPARPSPSEPPPTDPAEEKPEAPARKAA